MTREIDEQIVVLAERLVELIDRAHHGELIGIREADHAEPVSIGEDLADAADVVRGRREIVEQVVHLYADQERVEPPELAAPIGHLLRLLE